MSISRNVFFKAMLFCVFAIMGSSSCAARSYGKDRPAYVIYNADGKVIGYDELVRKVSRSDICLFGELHDNPIAHWMELQLVRDLNERKDGKLVIGAEMWETDNQLLLNELMASKIIDFPTYIENSRLWPNSSTDYLPILEYALDNDIQFVATNVPRRYAAIVADKGMAALDSLPSSAKSYLAPLPVKVDFKDRLYLYIAESFKMMTRMPLRKKDVSSLVEAQMLKDATMAYSISRNLFPDGIFFHFHGELHSALHSGIMYYLHEYCPDQKVVTVSMMEYNDPQSFEPGNDRADFYIVVPEDMTKTYLEQ